MSRTYLQVPFAQKDQAKRLGARWDAESRRWYVPAGVDLEAFLNWIPERSPLAEQPTARQLAESADSVVYPVEHTGSTAVSMADAPTDGMSLSQLLQRVEQVVALAFDRGQWTRIDLIDVRVRNGHVYLELAERDEQGRVLAAARGMIWNNTADRILPQFTRATGIELAAGIRLLARVRPVVHRRFGLTLEIEALDAAFSLGELEARRRQIRDRIRQEGLADLQRRLAPPFDFRRVLVLAPDSAAGLGDFRASIERWQAAGVCHFDVLHARFQGEGAAADLCRALESALARACEGYWDCLVILRGGGAVNDLAWLEDEALVRAVCLWPVPVLTGIGHERDRCLLDEFAHHAFDTPSKVAAGIIERIVQRASSLQTAFADIRNLARGHIAHARLDLARQRAELKDQSHFAAKQLRDRMSLWRDQSVHFGRQHLRQARTLAQQALQELQTRGRLRLRQRRELLDAQAQSIHRAAEKRVFEVRTSVRQFGALTLEAGPHWVHQRRQESEALLREVLGQAPERTLGRGFVLLRDPVSGLPITRKAATKPRQAVVVQFHDGSIQARLEASTPTTNGEEPPQSSMELNHDPKPRGVY